MTPKAIVVIGAGAVGCSVAWHLAARGVRDVVVVDRHPGPGGGSTAKATGGFRTQFGTEVNVRLSMLSREKLLRFREETGVDPGYEPRGYLFLTASDEDLADLRDAQSVQRRCGFAETEILSAEDALRVNPAVRDPEVRGGSFCPSDGFIRPMEIARGYAEAAQRLGVRFEYARNVPRLDPGVTYVNAAGAWAADLCDVPVTPLRRRVAGTVPTTVLPPDMPMTIWTSDGFHTRVRDGRVLLLRPDTPPDDGTWLAETIARAHRRIPALRDVAIDPDHCWSGLYEMSPDRHAIVGRHPARPNLYLANGSSGHGVMHAPALGQVIAEMIVDGRSSLDVHALRPSRFAEGDLIGGSTLL